MNTTELYGKTFAEIKEHVSAITNKDLNETYKRFRGLKSKGKYDIIMEQILENEIESRRASDSWYPFVPITQ